MYNKKVKLDKKLVYGKIIYKLELSQQWVMLITTKAERFYYDKINLKSVWQMPDASETETELKAAHLRLSEVKDLTLCLLASIRGMRLPRDIRNEIKTLFGIDDYEHQQVEDKIRGGDEVVVPVRNTLQKQYFEVENTSNVKGEHGDRDRDREEDRDRDRDEDREDRDDDSDEDEDDNEFALGISDIEDLIDNSDSEIHPVTKTGEDKDEIFEAKLDPEIRRYVSKYPALSKLNQDLTLCIKFVMLLESLKIDIYSAYDLEIDDVAKNPQYIISESNKLDDSTRREIWDEYCRVLAITTTSSAGTTVINKDESPTNSTATDTFSKLIDTPELEFIAYIKSRSFKFPKFYTDFNRQCLKQSKLEKDSTYPKLCKLVLLPIRQSIYSRWLNFLKTDTTKRIDIIYSSVNKNMGSRAFDEFLDYIKLKKQTDLLDLFFLTSEEFEDVRRKFL